MTQTQEERQSIEIYPRMTQLLKLTDKDFKTAIISLLEGIKENMLVINKQEKSATAQKLQRRAQLFIRWAKSLSTPSSASM